MKGKKKPLGLPSTLQQELGLGVGGGLGGSRKPYNKGKKKGGAPLSRKEVRTMELGDRSNEASIDRSID